MEQLKGEIIHMCARENVNTAYCVTRMYTCHWCHSKFSQLTDTVWLTLAMFELVIALQHLHYSMNINQRARSGCKKLKCLSSILY